MHEGFGTEVLGWVGPDGDEETFRKGGGRENLEVLGDALVLLGKHSVGFPAHLPDPNRCKQETGSQNFLLLPRLF